MGFHPANLALRFLLELAALAAAAMWGWRAGIEWTRYLLSALVPITMAVAWGVLAVPDDPSRSGSAPIPVAGVVRLGVEAVFFGFAVWALHSEGFTKASWALGVAVTLHYVLSYDRIGWLFRH